VPIEHLLLSRHPSQRINCTRRWCGGMTCDQVIRWCSEIKLRLMTWRGRRGTTPTRSTSCRPRPTSTPSSRKQGMASHGARPVHLIITMIKWIRTSRLSLVRLHAAQGLLRHHHRESKVLPTDLNTTRNIVLNLRATTSHKCEAVPRRARI